MLGIMPELGYDQNSIAVSPGDTLFCYTDGITEAMNESGEQFGMERMRQAFAETPPRDAQHAVDIMFDVVNAFAGDAIQSDDITCLALCRLG